MKEDTDKKRGQDKIVAEAKERFRLCEDYESERRSLSLDDLRFLDGDQWPQSVINERTRDGRPALVVNRMDQFVQQVTNALRMQRVSGRVFAVDDDADTDTAEVIQGHIRHIEYASDADLVYGTGAFYAVAIGWGGWRILTKYCNPYSFDLDIVLERFRNPFQFYLDPLSQHPTGRDAQYGFVTTDYAKEEYKRAFGKSALTQSPDWSAIGDTGGWVQQDSVRVAEYYTIEYTEDKLVRLYDGSAKLKGEMVDGDQPFLDEKGQPVERDTAVPVVKWYKINGLEVLEETVWPTSPKYASIPIIRVIGTELDVEGRLKLKGIIRNLKDAQRQYNIMLSAQTEAVDSSKGQIVISEGDLEGHEAEWSSFVRRKILTRKGQGPDGKDIPQPFRLQPNQSIQAMTEARLMAADDLKALTGIYDAALGAQSNETSGIAIHSRQAQSDTANYHYTGNLVRSINHSSRLILGAIPTVYDVPRSVKIVGEDEAHKVVRVNELFAEGSNDQTGKMYAFNVGEYDLVCEAGPAASTQKETDAMRMTELVKVAPGLMEVAPDLILKALGASQELVERVRKSLPPGLQDENKDGAPPIPPEVQQALTGLQAENEELKALLAEEQSGKADRESKERLAAQAQAHQVSLEEMKQDFLSMMQDDQQAHESEMAGFKADLEEVKSQVNHGRSMEMQMEKQAMHMEEKAAEPMMDDEYGGTEG